MPRPIAYLVCVEPNIVHLQELGLMVTPMWLHSLPYAVIVGPLFANDGRAVVHH